MFLAGKAFQGGAMGIVMATTQTYMSEILPPKLRGSILAFFPTFTLLGQLIGAGVIYACLDIDRGYAICFATQWPFSAIPFFVALVIPESPTYLVRRNKHNEAIKAQRRLDPPGTDTQQAIDLIARNIEHERKGSKATYVECFKGTNLRRTLIIVFANLMPQIFGLTLLSKASYFMQVIGMDPDLSLLVLIGGIACGFAANLVSIRVLSLHGRRRLLTLLSLTARVVLWASMGIAGIWSGDVTIWWVVLLPGSPCCVCGGIQNIYLELNPALFLTAPTSHRFTTVVLIIVIVPAGLGIWPCSYAIGSEASSLHLRARAQGIG